uniref:Protein-S-isoprenylcysteine O-methyltransferase n=1 Tax=Hemiselmis andersenii TaxID=464988 RepID=A0A6T8PQL1_HEMAN|mmetsp:Transcript_30946/g.72350  ORF Transcript_30946/g.72350 Transcript_30946/m.72350 type:complete len:246 (+) Transcript_30946:53-790(+)
MRASRISIVLLLIPACSCFSPCGPPFLRHTGPARNHFVGAQRKVVIPECPLPGRAGSLQQTKGSNDDSSDVINKVMSNTMEGEMGTRGEIYVGLQFGLIFLVVFGPAFQDLVESTSLLAGLALSVGGLGLGFIGVSDLGSNLTPWPKPVNDGTLQKDGAYGIVRHPLYGSLIVTCLGLSVLSLSFPRLLFTGMLYALLNAKSAREEEFLAEAYPDYSEYCNQVQDRLIPYASEAASLLRKVSGGK